MIRTVAKLIKVLNSASDPGQISLAVAFAAIAGLTPLMALHNLVVLLFVLVLKVNLSAFLLALTGFTLLAYLLDPVFHHVGLAVLTLAALEPVWTSLYNTFLGRLERFYNTIVMGSLVVSLVAFLPIHFVSRSLIVRYRETALDWVRKTRIVRAIQASKLYRVYQSLSDLRGAE